MKKNYQDILYSIFITCGGGTLFTSNMALKLFPNNAFLIYIIMIPLVFLFILMLPKQTNIINESINNKLLKTILFLYLLISGYFSISAFIHITNDYYYHETSAFVVLILIIICSIYVSTFGIKNIFKVGFVISFVISFLFVLILLSKPNYDLNLISYIDNKFSNFFDIFCFIFLFLDCILTYLFIPKKIKKTDLTLIIILSSIFLSMRIFEVYLFFNPEYFKDAKYPYLLKFFVYKNNNYFEHFDIFYLIMTTVFIIFHFSTQCEMARILLKIKRNKPSTIIYPSIIFIIVLLSSFITMTNDIARNIMIISSSLIMLYFIILSIRGKHERRNKKLSSLIISSR